MKGLLYNLVYEIHDGGHILLAKVASLLVKREELMQSQSDCASDSITVCSYISLLYAR